VAEKESFQDTVNYEIIISSEDAKSGIKKILERNGKRIEVKIPSGVKDRTVVKLDNALRVTDNKEGDILIRVKVRTDNLKRDEPAAAGVITITDSSFENEVLKSAVPVVVDFWAPWCGPCKMMSQTMEHVEKEYKGRIKFCKINVDENRLAASRYKAMSIPLLVFFKDGVEVDRSVGAVPENQLKSLLSGLL
jgi:thioredoxin 1